MLSPFRLSWMTVRAWMLIPALGIVAAAQKPPAPPKFVAGAGRVEGRVLAESGDVPLRRAHVSLRPAEAGLTTLGVECGDDGTFSIQQIPSGRYSLVAERDGYLTSAIFRRGALRMPNVFAIKGEERITDITFRLRPWAVIAGKIKFDDAEPGVAVRVDIFRQVHNRGRVGYHASGRAITNDRGEYRLFGLQPGEYLIAATLDRQPGGGAYLQQPRRDAEGRELPSFGYTTTFYPGSTKMSEAVTVHLEYSSEITGIDLVLKTVPRVRLRGRVIGGISGATISSPALSLQQLDASGQGSILSVARARTSEDGFEIPQVPPGQYLLQATGTDSGKVLNGSRLVTVSDQDVDNLDVLATEDRKGMVRFRTEGGGRLNFKQPVRMIFEPRTETSPIVTMDSSTSAGFNMRTGETYDLFMPNLPDDFYVSAIRVNGGDVMARGVEGVFASMDRPIEVVLDSRGGRVGGRVFGPDGTVWSGANVALIPDPPEGKLQAYREGLANEYGIFLLRGVPPGKYVIVAWLDERPCDYYDPLGMAACRATGREVQVEPSSQQAFELNVRSLR